MKQIFIVVLYFILYKVSIAQTYIPVTNVKTPKGSTVQGVYSLVSNDVSYSSFQLAAIAADISANYNGAELVDAPSYKYNCHAYAWHVSEGGDKIWIGLDPLSELTAEDIYWEDGSYIEVSESTATKVSYHQNGNHSAIRLNSDWYQSKWGASALVKHHPNDVPKIYQSSMTKKYYIRMPVITGPSSVCPGITGTFTVSCPPVGVNIIWSSSLPVSSGGNSAMVTNSTVLNSSSSGSNSVFSVQYIPPGVFPVTYESEAWIRAELVGTGIILEKHFTANTNSVDFDLPASAAANTILTVTAVTNVPAVTNWSITPFTGVNYQILSAGSLWLTFARNGVYTVKATVTNGCGTFIREKEVTVSGSTCNDCPPISLYVIVYPNPASDLLNVELKEDETVRNALSQGNSRSLPTTDDVIYQVRLYDGNGSIVEQKETSGKNIRFDTSKLPNGFYYIHVTDKTNNSLLSRQTVIIQH